MARHRVRLPTIFFRPPNKDKAAETDSDNSREYDEAFHGDVHLPDPMFSLRLDLHALLVKLTLLKMTLRAEMGAKRPSFNTDQVMAQVESLIPRTRGPLPEKFGAGRQELVQDICQVLRVECEVDEFMEGLKPKRK